MSSDDKIGRALAARRPDPARGYEERLRAAAARPRSRTWQFALAGFAVSAAAIVAIVVATRESPKAAVAAEHIGSAADPTDPPPPPAPPIDDPAPGDTGKPTPDKDRSGPGDGAPLAAYQPLLDDDAVITAALALDATVAAKLRDLADDLRKQRAQRAAEREVASIDLRRELGRTDIDLAKSTALYERVLAADVAIHKAELAARIGARALLTPAQRATVEHPPAPRTAVAPRAPAPPPAVGKRNPYSDRDDRDNDVMDPFDSRSHGRPGPKGELQLQSKPAARVFIDGVDTGSTTPMRLEVTPGRHKVTFVVGTDRYTFPTTVTANQTTKVVKELSASTTPAPTGNDGLTNPFSNPRGN